MYRIQANPFIKYGLILLVFSFLSCSNFMYSDKELDHLLGVKVVIGSKAYSYEEISGTRGEGYIFNKYVLTNETVLEFLKGSNKELFPKKDAYKTNWKQVNWQKGLTLNSNYYDLLTVFKQHKNEGLSKELSTLKMNLNSNDNYYSFFIRVLLTIPMQLRSMF